MLMFPIFTNANINLSFHFLQLIMKKLFFITLVASASMFFSNRLNAQVGLGGFPKSMTLGNSVQTTSSTITLERPDFEKLSKEDAETGSVGMYRTSITVGAGIDFHNSGSWTYLPNGEKIWRLSVVIPDAQGIVLMYDQYKLPKGVTLYLSNDNGRQILGGYTDRHNPNTDFYSNEPVVGQVVNIEMNIAADADVQDILFKIKSAAAFYRGLETETAFFNSEILSEREPFANSASCHVNAICPQSDIVADQRKSVARIYITGGVIGAPGGWCTGTLINNTGNSPENCRPLFITASHCDGDNGRTDEHFQAWQFRFNYLYNNCNGTGAPTSATSPTITGGAKFVARSNWPSMDSTVSGRNNSGVQDFLLLELNAGVQSLPTGAFMAGWNRKATYSENEIMDEYYQFTGLHHPAGDFMKLSATSNIYGDGTFNQSVVNNTHWRIITQVGGSSGGSSGSSLFDVYGRSLGVLSGGPPQTCTADGLDFGTNSLYSKFSYGWENSWEQSTFPQHAGPTSRLKDALDPAGTGLTFLNETSVLNCEVPNSIVTVDKLNENVFALFPNPSNNGLFNIKFNLENSSKEVQLSVYNALGQKVKNIVFSNITGQQSFNIDCSTEPAGIYMVNIQIDGQQLTKMISFTK